MSPVERPELCPCGRPATDHKPLKFSSCCGRFIGGDGGGDGGGEAGRPAPDAEALMRSRYSAFVLEDAAYLRATWHASTRPASIDFDAKVKWLGLQVKEHRRLDDDHAEVEFVARQRDVSGRAVRLHERSRFLREQGRWFYVDGDQFGS